MKNFFEVLKNNPLFSGIAYDGFEGMLKCLSAETASYDKDGIILLSGGAVRHVGLIISGSVRVIKEDFDGRISIMTILGAPEGFGEVFACAGLDHSPVTVQAAEKTEVLFVDYNRIVKSCSLACPFHAKLIENMLKLIAMKNLMLNQKIEILSKRTTRDKLTAFLNFERGRAKKFVIPYNREELAAYLCVDRSAMSNELCKMRDDGILKFKRSTFEIL